jgi:cysteinyl-tRNA synthetase
MQEYSKLINKMPLKLYNTLTRKKEVFKPINKNEVRMYVCGPTVYWFQHIGNLRSYIFSDILKRVLLYHGYKIKHVMNITDVGHLTSDADEGEDKIEKAAIKEGKRASDIANYYWKIFKEDFEKLNIIMPNIWCKATEHIKEQIEMIKNFEEKGYTYETPDGVYFDTSKFKDYGKLALLKKEGLQAGKRIDIGGKKNTTDFALWKFSEVPGIRQQEWNPKEYGAMWPIGFPGWHIECSAMSSKYLGEQFDIHTGGEDHIPIHHTNEIAQSEASFGKKPWVRFWLHGAFLTSKGEKVSKSKGGLFTITELEKKGYKPLDYRYFCLSGHYRTQLEFS